MKKNSGGEKKYTNFFIAKEFVHIFLKTVYYELILY